MTFCGDRGDGYFSERIIDFIHSFKYLVTFKFIRNRNQMSQRALGLFTIFFVLSGLISGCATLPPRLQESGLNTRFSFGNDVPFDEYVRKTGQMIEKTRVDINESNRAVILAANIPFELKPDESNIPEMERAGTREGSC